MLENNQKAYFPGIDLLKFISMFLVLILHILGQGGVLSALTGNQTNYWVAWFLEICAYCSVNCFAMATGYLMAGKKLKYRRIVPLWITVFFYTALFLILGSAYQESWVEASDYAFLLPVTSGAYWYFTAYFFLFFCIPFLNKLIEVLSKRQYIIMLLTVFILVAGGLTIGNTAKDIFKTSSGYSAWWLIYMYLVGAGIKKHGLFSKISASLALVGYFACCLLTLGSQRYIYDLLINNPKDSFIYSVAKNYGYLRFSSYISPTIICAGVFLMLFCLKLKLPKFIQKPLKWTAPLIFQVYIIHLHCVIWDNIMLKRFVSYAEKTPWMMVLYVLGTALAILLCCLLIDTVRYWLFKLLHIEPLIDLAADKITASYQASLEKREERKAKEERLEEQRRQLRKRRPKK